MFQICAPFQGDVGCGKTVVAFLACLEVISLGYQVSRHHFLSALACNFFVAIFCFVLLATL